MIVWMLLAQIVLDHTPSPPVVGPILTRNARLAGTCPRTADDDDVVVCARPDSERYRLRPIGPPPNGRPLPPATMRIGNGTLDARARERCVGGFCAPAAMATLKLPF